MSMIVRPVQETDLEDLYDLAKEFLLLNLPRNRRKLRDMIRWSEESFSQEFQKSQKSQEFQKIDKFAREYIFVVEDVLKKKIVATAKIVTQHGTPEEPHVYYKVLKEEKYSESLGFGFTHQVLHFCEDSDGPTELGGLVVSKDYREHPDKIGKLVSLVRFLYIAIQRDDFRDRLHTELAPPLNSKGKSEFWEALGRRFTELSYNKANRLSHLDKEFITSLFPKSGIYVSLLDPKARMVIGQVGSETKPALKLMEKFGFVYKNEIDPFDGGPHMGVNTDEAKPIQALQSYKISLQKADLQKASLQKADLQKASLQKADLQKADLQKTDLQKADLQKTDLQKTDLQKADLQKTDLQKASLQKADLQKADLQKADLQKNKKSDSNTVLLGGWGDKGFRAIAYKPEIRDKTLYMTQEINLNLNFVEGQKIFVIPFDYTT